MTTGEELKPRLGFIGLGEMGSRMAMRLLKAGYPLTVYNRTKDKTQPFTALGATDANTPRELATQCQVIISCVTNDAALESVILDSESGALAGAGANAIFIDISTVFPATSRRIFDAAASQNLQMIDAAVSGSTPQAEEGTLVVFVGGKPETYEQCKDILSVLGKDSFYMGASGMGTAMKLVVNTLLGLGLQAVAEAIALGEKSGLDREVLLNVLGQTAVIAPTHKAKLKNAQQNQYPPTFPLELMYKDFDLILAEAHKLHVSMPATAIAEQISTMAQEKSAGEDYSVVIKLMRQLAGIAEE